MELFGLKCVLDGLNRLIYGGILLFVYLRGVVG